MLEHSFHLGLVDHSVAIGVDLIETFLQLRWGFFFGQLAVLVLVSRLQPFDDRTEPRALSGRPASLGAGPFEQ